MAAYAQDIPQIMAWTMPQLRLLARYRDIRERDERKWQLVLATGAQSQEGTDALWAQLDGEEGEQGEYSGVVAGGPSSAGGSRSHTVDSRGNVVAPGAPLLADIALGKAVAPPTIPITVIDKSKPKEEDA